MGRMDGDVRMMLQDSKRDSFVSEAVSSRECAVSGLVAFLEAEFDVEVDGVAWEERRSHVNASMSSRISEWIRRCALLCAVLSNR